MGHGGVCLGRDHCARKCSRDGLRLFRSGSIRSIDLISRDQSCLTQSKNKLRELRWEACASERETSLLLETRRGK